MSTLSTVQNVYVPNFMDLTLENALDSGWIVLFVPKVKSVKNPVCHSPWFPFAVHHCNSIHFCTFSPDMHHCKEGSGSLNLFLVFERNEKLPTDNVFISTPMKISQFETQNYLTFSNFEGQKISNSELKKHTWNEIIAWWHFWGNRIYLS